VGLKAVSLESRLSKTETAAPLSVGDYPTKTLFDKGLQGCPLTMGHLARVFKKTVRYLYGCLHMALYIILYGKMSRECFCRLGRLIPARILLFGFLGAFHLVIALVETSTSGRILHLIDLSNSWHLET
jgi:hypothetical protein